MLCICRYTNKHTQKGESIVIEADNEHAAFQWMLKNMGNLPIDPMRRMGAFHYPAYSILHRG